MTKVARLEQEVQILRHELEILRFDRDELYRKHGTHLKRCSGGESCKKFSLEAVLGEKSQKQDLYIAFLEDQIKQTRHKYQKQMRDVKSSAKILEKKLQNVRQEMNCITVQIRQVDKLKKNVQVLKTKLQRRDTIIARYNEQNTDFVRLGKSSDQQSTQEDIVLDQIEADDGCGKDRKDSKIVSANNPEPKLNFVCLNAALKKKNYT